MGPGYHSGPDAGTRWELQLPQGRPDEGPILFICLGTDGSGIPGQWSTGYRRIILHETGAAGSRRKGAWVAPCPAWPLNLARRVKETFVDRPLVLIGFSRGAWWGFEWFISVEPGLFDRLWAVGGYPLNKWNGEESQLRFLAESLKRHPNRSVWIASMGDSCCAVTQGYQHFYKHLLQDQQSSSCVIRISSTLDHIGLRRQFIENMAPGLITFINTGQAHEVLPLS